MNLFCKQMLFSAKSDKYEAYRINWSGTSIVKLIGDVTDVSKTFSPEYSYSNVYVYNGDMYYKETAITNSGKVTAVTGRSGTSIFYIEDGKLYYYNSNTDTSTQIGTDTTWTQLSGYTLGNYKAFGVNSSGLYYLNTDSVVQVSTISDWSIIVGTGNTKSTGRFGYGISQGKLYRLTAYANGATQIGTDTTWTNISGVRNTSSTISYGIARKYLYALDTGTTRVGSYSLWESVSGYSYSTYRGLAIRNGRLYILNGTTATQVGTDKNWQMCSGYCTTTEYGLAYTDDALYGVLSDGSIRKLMDGKFVYVGGMFSSNTTASAYGVAIKKK